MKYRLSSFLVQNAITKAKTVSPLFICSYYLCTLLILWCLWHKEVLYGKLGVMWYFLLGFQLNGKYGMFYSILDCTDLIPTCDCHVHTCRTGPEEQ